MQGVPPERIEAILEIVRRVEEIDGAYLTAWAAGRYYDWDPSRRRYYGSLTPEDQVVSQWFLTLRETILADRFASLEAYAGGWIGWLADVVRAVGIVSWHTALGMPAEASWVTYLARAIAEKADRGNTVYGILRRHGVIRLSLL